MRVIVFGATGTVGAYACLHLKAQGMDVVATGRRQDDGGFFQAHGISYVPADVCQRQQLERLPQEDVYGIVHLAGMLPARMSGYRPQVYIDTNMTGTLNILEYAARLQVQCVVGSQSIADVDYLCGSTAPIPADVESRFPLDNDHSVYSITKTAAANLVQHYAHHCGFRHYMLRFPNIYLYHPNPYYYVDGKPRMQGYRQLIYRAISGEPIEIWGNPQRRRDMVYVKDCVQIIALCLTHDHAHSGYYNVGTGIGTTLEEQVRGIVSVFSPDGHPSPILYRPEKADAAEYVFDISKTRRELGYTPRYGYLDYLEDFRREMHEQRFARLWGTEQDYLKQP